MEVGFGRSERAVRVNSIQSEGGLCEDDLRAVLTAEVLPDALVVPKVRRVLAEQAWAAVPRILCDGGVPPHCQY